jgi:hypothetical protein
MIGVERGSMSKVEQEALWALESDFASLGSQAAIALDKLVLGEEAETEAVERLVDRISVSMEVPISDWLTSRRPVSESLISPTTVVLMTEAMGESRLAQDLKTVGEVVKQTRDVASRLRKVLEQHGIENDNKRELEELRAFCLALSRKASASEPSVLETMGEHICRR